MAKGDGSRVGDNDYRPEPMTPFDCDLRDFQFMPLDVVRFAQSDLVAFEEPEAVLANILLWGASWHSVPAASLTNDDRALARLAGYGRGALETWGRIRVGALHGWVECNDGRLYHPVVAEKARDSWDRKLKQRHRTLCAAVRKHNERHPNEQIKAPSYEEWEALGRPDNVTRDSAGVSRVTRGGMSRSCHADNGSKGQGERQGQGQGTPFGSQPKDELGESPSRACVREAGQ